MKLTTILPVGIALALPMCANSTKHNTPRRSPAEYEEAFRKMDTNHNGYLSRQELAAKAKDPGKSGRTFVKKDIDGDGRLTEQEFAAKTTRNR
jgi:Ca2+-binding EF-hand superfamily protein